MIHCSSLCGHFRQFIHPLYVPSECTTRLLEQQSGVVLSEWAQERMQNLGTRSDSVGSFCTIGCTFEMVGQNDNSTFRGKRTGMCCQWLLYTSRCLMTTYAAMHRVWVGGWVGEGQATTVSEQLAVIVLSTIKQARICQQARQPVYSNSPN